jgi:hypothetical protein
MQEHVSALQKDLSESQRPASFSGWTGQEVISYLFDEALGRLRDFKQNILMGEVVNGVAEWGTEPYIRLFSNEDRRLYKEKTGELIAHAEEIRNWTDGMDQETARSSRRR